MMRKKRKFTLPPPQDIEVSAPPGQPRPSVGCFLGWQGCTGTADIAVGNGWICHNCSRYTGERGQAEADL